MNPASLIWLFYGAILLHGIRYDFFFMTGQLCTDQQAPHHLRGAAQGSIMFLTYGVGMFLGSLLSGWTVDFFTTAQGQRDWKAFWLSSSACAFVILLLLAIFFKSREKIRTQNEPAKRTGTSNSLTILRRNQLSATTRSAAFVIGLFLVLPAGEIEVKTPTRGTESVAMVAVAMRN